jgi:hypothetical protein
MELTDVGAVLLFANAAAHLVGFRALRQVNGARTHVVAFGAFVAINAALGSLVLAGAGWSEWLAIAFPALGGLSLAATMPAFVAPRWMAYTVLSLDVGLVVVFGIAVL